MDLPGPANPRHPRRVGAVLGLTVFGVYLTTLQTGLGAGDSGEFVAVAHELGVAHPPGYPLYTLLLFAWQHLLFFVDPVLASHLFSAVTQAAAAVVLARAVRRWTEDTGAALVAGGAWAFAAPTWKTAVVAEVFALNALFAAVLLDAFVTLVRRREDARAVRGASTRIVLLSALLLAHHHTLVLLVAPLLLVGLVLVRGSAAWARRRPRDLVVVLLAGIAGLLPLIHLPLAARGLPTFTWGDPRDPEGFVHHLLRRDYGTFSLDPLEAGHEAGVSHGLLWLGAIPRELGPLLTLGVLIAGVVLVGRALRPGSVSVAKADPAAGSGPGAATRARALLALVAGFLALQLWFFTRVGFPVDPPVYRGVVERFHVLPDLVLAFVGGIGLAILFRALRARTAGATTRVGLVTLVAAGIGVPLFAHHGVADQSDQHLVEELVHNVLASVPENGALFVQGDLFQNGLAVATLVRGEREDLAWADQEILTYPWGVDRARRRHPGLLPDPLGQGDVYDPDDPSSWNVHWFDHLVGRRPVAVIGVKESSWNARYDMVPHGYVSLVVPKGEAPSLEVQARQAVQRLERLRFEALWRPGDPWSFENHEHGRGEEVLARTALLLCQPGGLALRADSHPGIARLDTLLDRAHRRLRRVSSWSGARIPDPTPGFLQAAGAVSTLHPDLLDPERARDFLRAHLATDPAPAEAQGSRQLLQRLSSASGDG